MAPRDEKHPDSLYGEFSKLGGPYNQDYSIWGSILGSPYFGKLPYLAPGYCLASPACQRCQERLVDRVMSAGPCIKKIRV